MGFLISPPGKTHARNSSFVPPPLDGSLTIPEIYDWHYQHNPSHALFTYSSDGEQHYYRYSDIIPAVHRAGRSVITLTNKNATKPSLDTVAILASTDLDTITYFIIVLGIVRAGIPVFPISPRNSAAAVAHLLAETHASHILTSSDLSIAQLAKDAISEMRKNGVTDIPAIRALPAHADIYKDVAFEPLPTRKYDYDAPSAIVHSSGSTSFPKPIGWNPRNWLQSAITPWFGKEDLCEQVVGCHGIAMFHAIGMNFIGWATTTGLIMATFPPVSPPPQPSPKEIFNGIVKCNPSYVFAVPSIIEEWAHDPAKVSKFAQLKGLIYGGSSLSKTVGDALTASGVKIYTFYGLSEAGVVGSVIPEHPGRDWEYFTINAHCAAEFVDSGDGSYELIVLSKPTQELTIINTQFRGLDAYATNDLLVPHPEKSGYWKLIGRSDDQLVLSTGEKTNPGPLEAIIRQHPKISAVLMFGHGRFQSGLLIEPKEDYLFDPEDIERLNDFRNEIWFTVEQMNDFAPTHSRVFKEMIIPSTHSKPFVFTPKGAVKRRVVLELYKKEIESLYEAAERGFQVQNTVEIPLSWSTSSCLSFIRAIVNGTSKWKIGDHDNIFEMGCDSLQATWIKNSILHSLRNIPGFAIQGFTSTNFIYENPTIDSMSNYLLQVATQASDFSQIDKATKRIAQMKDLVSRYTSLYPTHVPTTPVPEKDIVLLTGTTGALGCAILASLVESSDIVKVYALNRPGHRRGGLGIVERQRRALHVRGYDPDLVYSPKVKLVEGEISADGINGIDPTLEREICKTCTHIIHTAWPVDFNLSLASFEKAIGGVKGLVDLSLRSPQDRPPRLIFTSSIGVLSNTSAEEPTHELRIDDPSIAIGQGYSESKWVAESILYNAGTKTSLRPIVVRVGQISGSRINGAWNTSDWFPSIIKSSLGLGVLPEIPGSCSWIPLDLAARVLVEIRNAEEITLHLAHPKPVLCAEILRIVAGELSLRVCSSLEWISLLENEADNVNSSQKTSTEKLDRFPALKLLEFMTRALRQSNEHGEAMGLPRLDVRRALEASQTLRDASSLGKSDVCRWLQFWKDVKFIGSAQKGT